MKYIKKWLGIALLPIIVKYIAYYYFSYHTSYGDTKLEFTHIRNIEMFVFLFKWVVIGYLVIDVMRYLLKRYK